MNSRGLIYWGNNHTSAGINSPDALHASHGINICLEIPGFIIVHSVGV